MNEIDGVKEENGILLLKTKKICELMKVTDKTMTNWKRQGCPQYARGWWDLQKVLEWRGTINSGESAEEKKGMNLAFKKLEAEVTYKEAQAELTRLKTEIQNGLYVKKEEVEAELQRFFLVFKKSLTSLQRKLASTVEPYIEEVEARRTNEHISNIMLDALTQLSIDGVYNVKKAPKQ